MYLHFCCVHRTLRMHDMALKDLGYPVPSSLGAPGVVLQMVGFDTGDRETARPGELLQPVAVGEKPGGVREARKTSRYYRSGGKEHAELGAETIPYILNEIQNVPQ